jgi:hypothetical protein
MVVKCTTGEDLDEAVGVQPTPHTLLTQVRVVLKPVSSDNI